ncbi:copper resistance protein NlpE [Shewanella waksmanii]|uniref:copper resistance protein NlpE n=1 Tax=Shewanella waksmanii TaxID=213783 RepID=UPI003735D353
MKIVAPMILALMITGCSTTKQPASPTPMPAHLQAADPIPVGDTSQNALDWNGTYQGVTPCASCEGIATEITLNRDNTFTMRTQYLGENEQVFESTGTLFWLGQGNIIRLGEGESQPLFLVGENQLFMLDKQGKRIQGALAEHYRLTKTH